MSNAELIAEARDFTFGWERDEDKRAWRPFDQSERIRHWDETHPIESPEHAEFVADRKAWEDVHAHDARLKCFPEFQCGVIESYAADVVIRLADALEAASKDLATESGIAYERLTQRDQAREIATSFGVMLKVLGHDPRPLPWVGGTE